MTFGVTARTAALIGIVCLALAGAVLAQGKPVELGTWRLNVAKSKFVPGPAPKSSTVIYSAAGQGLKTAVEAVSATGKLNWEYTTNFDGKPSSVTGNPDADMAVVKRIDANTVEIAQTLKGKPTLMVRRTLSADGKTMTVTQTGTDAKGQKVNNVLVFERG
jgi:hypothetical protein